MNQYYRVHAVIDLDAICHNIREVKTCSWRRCESNASDQS